MSLWSRRCHIVEHFIISYNTSHVALEWVCGFDKNIDVQMYFDHIDSSFICGALIEQCGFKGRFAKLCKGFPFPSCEKMDEMKITYLFTRLCKCHCKHVVGRVLIMQLN